MVPSSLTNRKVSPLNAAVPAELKTVPVGVPEPGGWITTPPDASAVKRVCPQLGAVGVLRLRLLEEGDNRLQGRRQRFSERSDAGIPCQLERRRRRLRDLREPRSQFAVKLKLNR